MPFDSDARSTPRRTGTDQSPGDASDLLATAVIPWTHDWRFDEVAFRRQVQLLAGALTRHLYLFGTAGEGYAVTDAQFDEIAAAFWRAARDYGVSPMLGVISLSLPTIVARIARGRELGFRQFQLSLPAWGALNDAELDTFFAETCGRFPDCRFHHYNLLRTKRLLNAGDYRRLASAHPNLVAVKCSTDDPALLADLLTMAPRLRFYFTEFGYAIARHTTADIGLLVSVSTANHARAREFVAGTHAGRAEAVAELRTIVAALKDAAAGRFHMDGAFDKMLYRLSDPHFPLRLLPPYASATEAEFERFRAAIPARWRV